MHQLLDDEIIQGLLREQQQIIQAEYNELYQAREHVYDIQEKHAAQQREMNGKLQKRMVELGITNDRFRNGYFKEFDIRDMYKLKGTLCKACSKGIQCKKHTYERQGRRQNKLYNE